MGGPCSSGAQSDAKEGALAARARLMPSISLWVNAHAAASTGNKVPRSVGVMANQRNSTLRTYAMSAPPPFSIAFIRALSTRTFCVSFSRATSSAAFASRVLASVLSRSPMRRAKVEVSASVEPLPCCAARSVAVAVTARAVSSSSGPTATEAYRRCTGNAPPFPLAVGGVGSLPLPLLASSASFLASICAARLRTACNSSRCVS